MEEFGQVSSWPRFGREKHCAVCDKELTGRQVSFCGSRECRALLWRRLYRDCHWQKRHVIVRDGPICRHCGEIFESPLVPGGPLFPEPAKLELDHIQPLSKGGSELEDNLQVLCKSCHQQKTTSERRGGDVAER